MNKHAISTSSGGKVSGLNTYVIRAVYNDADCHLMIKYVQDEEYSDKKTDISADHEQRCLWASEPGK